MKGQGEGKGKQIVHGYHHRLLLYVSVTTVEYNFTNEFLKLLKSTRLHSIDIIYNYFYLYNNNCINISLNQIT